LLSIENLCALLLFTLVFWVALGKWLAFSSLALKRVFQKKKKIIIVFTLRAMVSFAFVSYGGKSRIL